MHDSSFGGDSLMRSSNEAQIVSHKEECGFGDRMCGFEPMGTETHQKLKRGSNRFAQGGVWFRGSHVRDLSPWGWKLMRGSNEAQIVSHKGEYVFGDRVCSI